MKISIITATYNSAETLQNTIDSVLEQDYQNFEHIIIDGGSKDETLAIIKANEARYNGKLVWVSESDKGIYDAMNKGIARATGDVVGILNSDDFYTSKDVLSTIAAEFENNPEIAAVYADVKYVDWNDTNKLVRYYSSGIFSRSLMRLGFMPAHPTFYCKKSTYEKFKLDGTKIDGFKGNPNCAYFNTTYNQYVKCDKACITCTAGLKGDNTNCLKCNDGTHCIKCDEGYEITFNLLSKYFLSASWR